MRKGKAQAILYYAASFVLPMLLILLAMVWLRITPFGDKSFVISDANGLYLNSLSYAGRLFRGLEGVTYSFEKGLGGNMMAYMGGTLLNPFYLFFSFSDILDYVTAYSFVCVGNLSLCGLTMYILLKDFYGHRVSNLIFSTTYALIGFNVANAWQVIFFTGVQMLPLMVLGLRRIFQGRTPWLYILSLAYTLLTNFYFGFTLCVVSVLMFLAVLWQEKKQLKGKELSIFVNYTISSLLSGLLSMVVWLPAFLSLRGGRLNQTGLSDFSFAENMPFLEIGAKLFSGANSTSELVDGLPNIFVGLLPVALVILYFCNQKVEKRKKIVAGTLLVFYLLMFYVIAFDMLMHGGTVTNWFNYRYSYIFSFLVLLVAAYEWQFVLETPKKQVLRCFGIMVVAAIVILSKRYEFLTGGAVVFDFMVLTVMGLAYDLHRKDQKKNPAKTVTAMVLLLTCVNLFGNFALSMNNLIAEEGWYTKPSEYQETVAKVRPLVYGAELASQDFYRMEVNKQRSGNCGNDPFLYGYNGVGVGGSNERNFVREELNKLGVQRYDMRNYYAEGIPAATDALLGLRYLVANADMTEEKQYVRMTDVKKMGLAGEGDVYDLFQSEYALPIAFLSEKAVNELELTYDDVFDNLNRVWKAISGTDKAAFVEEDDITFETRNMVTAGTMDARQAREIVAQYETKSSSDSASASGSESSDGSSGDQGLTTHPIMEEEPQFSSSVEFSFTAKQDGPVYVYHRAGLSDVQGSYEPVLKYMGCHHKGDTVTGYLLVDKDYVDKVTFEEFSGRFRAAYADLDALQSMSEAVRKQPATLEKTKESQLTGTFQAKENQELLFTIPWDEGWTCYVDGQKAHLKKVLGIFMAVQVDPGEHTYEMRYQPAGMKIGIQISAVTAVLMLLYLCFARKAINGVLEKKTVSPAQLPLSDEKTHDSAQQ